MKSYSWFKSGFNSRYPVSIVVLLAISVAARVVFSLVYTPKFWPPTELYLELAHQFLSGDYTGYIGRITPVYSFLIIATGFNFGLLALVQKLMAVFITVLVFLIFKSITRSEKIAFISALAYTLNPSQWLFEASFFPEELTTFLLTVSSYLAVRLLDGSSSARWWKFLLLGFVSTLCLLTRPHYQFLPVLLLVFTIWRLGKGPRRTLVASSAALLLPVALLAGSWMMFQQQRVGRASLTNHAGVTLLYHAVNFLEYAPDEYADVKAVLRDGIDEYLKKGTDTYGVVEAVMPELQNEKGFTFSQVDSLYLSMALATIKAAPHLYLKSIIRAGLRFFKPYWYSRQFGIKSVLRGNHFTSKVIAVGYSIAHLCLMAAFIVFPLLLAVYRPFRLKEFFSAGALYFYSLIGMTFAIQAVMVFGENSRFRVSVEPLMYGIAVWCLWRLGEIVYQKCRNLKT